MADFYTPGAEIPSVSTIPSTDDIVNALKGFGQTAMSVPIVNSAVHGFTGAHDALQSTPENPYTTTKAMEDAHNMMGLMGGASPAGIESGAAGIFGGRLAKTAPHDAFVAAKDMENMSGRFAPSRDQIYEDTGIWRGPEGRQRFEISDAAAHPSARGTYLGSNDAVHFDHGVRMQDVLHHPDLFGAYPNLGNMKVYAENTGNLGAYYPEWTTPRGDIAKPVFGLKQGLPYEDFMHTVLHELQHGVQDIERFHPGSNPVSHYPQGYPPLKEGLLNSNDKWSDFFNQQGLHGDKAVESIVKYLSGAPEDPMVQQALDVVRNTGKNDPFSNWLKAHQLATEQFERPAHLQYRMSPGELEAENVAARRNLGPAEARFTPPWQTQEDVVNSILKKQQPK